MAMKQLIIPLCDIKQNPPEEVLSLCKNPLLFSELFGESEMLRKCQIQVKCAGNEPDDSASDEEEEVHRDDGTELKNGESDCAPLSDYEKMIAKKQEEELAFLNSVGIGQREEDRIIVRKRRVTFKLEEETEEPICDRKRTLRNLENVKYAERESNDSTSEEESELGSELGSESSGHTSSDEDFELNSKSSRYTSSQKKLKGGSKRKKYSSRKSASLSDYEKMIAEKNKERLALLTSLGVIQAKDDFCEMVSGLKPKPVKRATKVQGPSEPQRSSRRLAQQTGSIDFNEDTLYQQQIEKTQNDEILEMSFKTTLLHPDMYENYLEDFNFQNPIGECKTVHYDENVLKNLTLTECSFEQDLLAPSVLAWYPSSEDLIIALANKNGRLSILNLGSESDPSLFKPHVGSITNLLFNPLNCVHMVSSSFDGSVCCADLVKHTFTKIYMGTNAASKCSYFDFLSLTTCLVADHDGEVTLIDYRTNKIAGEMKHQCHKCKINTVHVHPVHKHNFVTACNDSSIRLWDLRMLQKTPATYAGYNSPVRCAYFSPGTGNSILSTSFSEVRIIDSECMTSNIRMIAKETIHFHNAKWLPDSQSMYVLNCTRHQEGIEVYDKDTKICHRIHHEKMRVKGLNTFHPCTPVLAGITGNSDYFFFSYKP